ncbi:PREDICTED: probable receptor-like protein kinase At1g80640 [Tarenaya hassleriana]|uniref:probable receptor-like protein kinase At1g80640 n=1 Tax=Tarenaya hassleriana TaxID=28532 RepID=UPI00053C735B|nr:PREDICTED: probable receptor-like protein kinase At1g80640 [Tarenaya hassleriana]
MRGFVLTILVLLHASALRQSTCAVFSATEESRAPQPSASMDALSPGAQPGEAGLHNVDTHKRVVTALAAAFASVGIVLVCSLFYWVFHRKSSSNSKQESLNSSDCEGSRIALPWLLKRTSCAKPFKKRSKKQTIELMIDYETIEKGTGSFRETNILGQGGFGCVYTVKLENNVLAAVKKLDCGTEEATSEFKNEVEILRKMQHPSIISLLGYSMTDTTRFIVYELMQNGSLESQLHGPSRGSALTWHMRMKIALDTSRGLEYLHEYCHPPIIHRDLKTSNILLDSSFNAKISDFGLAVTSSTKSNNIKLSGTIGYVAPEYLLDGQLTEKSDVYAFGVVLLELLLGRRPMEKLAPTECQSIVTWAMPHLTDRTKLPNVVDPAIKDTMDLKHLYQVAAVAVLCVQPEPSYRPLIRDVLHSLIPLVPMELGGTLRTASSVDHR